MFIHVIAYGYNSAKEGIFFISAKSTPKLKLCQTICRSEMLYEINVRLSWWKISFIYP